MNTIASIVLVAVFLVTLFDGTRAGVVKHAGSLSLRKPLRVSKPSAVTFNIFKRDHSEPELNQNENYNGQLYQANQRQTEQPPPDSAEHNFMVITTATNIPDHSQGERLSGSDGGPDNESWGGGGLSVEMMIIDIEDAPSQANRKVAKKFGSDRPLSLGQSPFRNDDESQEFSRIASSTPNSFGQAATDGLREALQRILIMEAGPDSPINFRNFFSQAQATATDSKAQTPKPPASSLTMAAEKPQMSYPKASPIPSAKPTESIAINHNQNKQILLGSTQTFDNTSHHSQL